MTRSIIERHRETVLNTLADLFCLDAYAESFVGDLLEKLQFGKFREGRELVEDLGERLKDECLSGVAGYVYLNALYIEEPKAPGDDEWPKYLLVLGREEYMSDSLEELERRLFCWALSEHYAI